MNQHPLRTASLLILSALFLTVASCDDNGFTPTRYDDIGPFDTTGVESVKAPNGLLIYMHEEGHGEQIAESHAVRLRYTGRTTDGDIFDSSFRNEVDAPTTLQIRNMITGFMQGLAGFTEVVDGEAVRRYPAREGSRRTLVIPPELGYGGSSGHQLRNDTLIFDVDIISIASEN